MTGQEQAAVQKARAGLFAWLPWVLGGLVVLSLAALLVLELFRRSVTEGVRGRIVAFALNPSDPAAVRFGQRVSSPTEQLRGLVTTEFDALESLALGTGDLHGQDLHTAEWLYRVASESSEPAFERWTHAVLEPREGSGIKAVMLPPLPPDGDSTRTAAILARVARNGVYRGGEAGSWLGWLALRETNAARRQTLCDVVFDRTIPLPDRTQFFGWFRLRKDGTTELRQRLEVAAAAEPDAEWGGLLEALAR